MRIKTFIPVLLILLCPLLLGASCDGGTPPSATPTVIGITPKDTTAKTLQVIIGIAEDQNRADGKSKLIMRFRTNVVTEDNFVKFVHQEAVTCNGVTQKLNDASVYTLQVAEVQNQYACTYTGYAQDIGQLATPVPMITLTARSVLAPHNLSVDSKGYTIDYTPDTKELACPITADATDGARKISGSGSVPPLLSDRGQYQYQGSDIASLTGEGSILLTRTCSATLRDTFDTVNWTYESKAKVPVTWKH
jgi:hypothetical protein